MRGLSRMLRSRVAGAAIVLAFPLAAANTPLASADAGSDALTEIRKLEAGPRHWTTRRQELHLTTGETRGGSRERDLIMLTHKDGDKGEQTLTVFLSPPEVRGTAFLQMSLPDLEIEQWIFLPALERVRRITSRARDQSFVGTAFSYRDLELLTDAVDFSEDEAPSKLLETRPANGDAPEQLLIERRAGSRSLGYDAVVVEVDSSAKLVRALRFLGEDGKLKKQLAFQDIRKLGQIPTPHKLVMQDEGRGSTTTVLVTEVIFDEEVSPDLFTEQGLEDALELLEN